jgi:hypothetical protein
MGFGCGSLKGVYAARRLRVFSINAPVVLMKRAIYASIIIWFYGVSLVGLIKQL